MTCSNGSQSKLLVDAALPFDASSERFDFIYESIKKSGRIVGERGITGTRSNHVERTRIAPYKVGGQLAMDMCTLDLDKWLPRILGAAESSNSFTLAETLPTFYMLIDKVGGIYRYDGCVVDKVLINAEADPDGEGSLVTVLLTILAKTEEDEAGGITWPASEPSLAVTANRTPFIMHEGVFTVGGVAYQFKDFALLIDNNVKPRWVNSISATELCPADRYVVLRTTHPFTSTERDAFIASTKQATAAAGVSSSLVFTNSTYVTTFTLAGLQWQGETPTVPGKVEIDCPIEFVARMKSTDREIVVTNAS